MAWRRIVKAVHDSSPAKFGMQLGHAGRKASTKLFAWEGSDRPLDSGNWPIASERLADSVLSDSQVPMRWIAGTWTP